MRIGELAMACQTSVRMLRFYERLGLLHPVRAPNGYRHYRPEDAAYVRKVMLLNQAGLPLKDSALLHDCLNDAPQDFCDVLRGKLRVQLVEIDTQLERLQASRTLIQQLLAGEGRAGNWKGTRPTSNPAAGTNA